MKKVKFGKTISKERQSSRIAAKKMRKAKSRKEISNQNSPSPKYSDEMTNSKGEKSKEQILKEYVQIMTRKSEVRGEEYKINPLAVKYPNELTKSDKEVIIALELEEIEKKSEDRRRVLKEKTRVANEIDKEKKRVAEIKDQQNEERRNQILETILAWGLLLFVILFILTMCGGGGGDWEHERYNCGHTRC